MLDIRTMENDIEKENQENSEFNRGGRAPRTCLLKRIGDPLETTKHTHGFSNILAQGDLSLEGIPPPQPQKKQGR